MASGNMGLRCPKDLDDIGLLQDEPFKSKFLAHKFRDEGPGGRTRSSTNLSPATSVSKELRNDCVSLKAVQAWVELAFDTETETSNSVRKPKAEDPATVKIFVHFYWLLYQDQKREARDYLFKKKKQRGYTYIETRSPTTTSSTSRKDSSQQKHHDQPPTEDGYEAEDEDNASNDTAHHEGIVASVKSLVCPDGMDVGQHTTVADGLAHTICNSSNGPGISSPLSSVEIPSKFKEDSSKRKATMEHPSSDHPFSPPEIDSPNRPPLPSSRTAAHSASSANTSQQSMASTQNKRPKMADTPRNITSPPVEDNSPAGLSVAANSVVAPDTFMADSDSSLTSLSCDEASTNEGHGRGRGRGRGRGHGRGRGRERGRGRRPRTAAPLAATRVQPRRSAANAEKLSRMMTSENRYEEKLERGCDDVSDDEDMGAPVSRDEEVADINAVASMSTQPRAPVPEAAAVSPTSRPVRKDRRRGGRKSKKQRKLKLAEELLLSPAKKRRCASGVVPIEGPEATHVLPAASIPVSGDMTGLENPSNETEPHEKDSTVNDGNKCVDTSLQTTVSPQLLDTAHISESMSTVDGSVSNTKHSGAKKKHKNVQTPPTPISPPIGHVSQSIPATTFDPSSSVQDGTPSARALRAKNREEAAVGPPRSKSRKRKRHLETTDAQSPSPASTVQQLSQPGEHRAIAALPKPRGNKTMQPLRPSSQLNLTSVDMIVCHAGAEGRATLSLRNTAPPPNDWDNDDNGPPDFPDDSSDEDDSPRIILSRGRMAMMNSAEPIIHCPDVDVTLQDAMGESRVTASDPEDQVMGEPYAANPSSNTTASQGSGEASCPLSSSCRVDPLQTEPYTEEPIQVMKQPLQAYPPIWAQSRQEVCESFDWFRSYQGGVYFVKDMAKGYLLSAFSASRDIFRHDGKLIISHGGGKAQSLHKNHGQIETHQASDQLAEDKSVRALLRTYELQRPLVLIIDDKYALFPYDLSSKGCTYAILGFYRIAHAWAEKQRAPNSEAQVVRYKFAFQWCEEQREPPWWISQTVSTSSAPSQPSSDQHNHTDDIVVPPSMTPTEGLYRHCSSCQHCSPQVYRQGWMCLKPTCDTFWKLESGIEPGRELTYMESFTQLLVFPPQLLEDIKPPSPKIYEPEDGITTSCHFCKGWHCTECGRLSSRYKWEDWECRNCGATVQVTGRIRKADEFRHQLKAGHFLRHKIMADSGIILPLTQLYNFGQGFSSFATFILPEQRGRIHVIFSAPLGNGIADEILSDYQNQAAAGELKFRRWPLRAHKCRGTLLTNYFSQNTGEPYQYVGGTDNTVPFDAAPSAVVRALELIRTRMKEALNIEGHFNEVLSAAYMEKQKMAFHSDSERGLGPVVASLSLGASAYMHFRLHHQYAGELQNPSSRDVLSLYLRHGDVVVMEGANVQKYYEHTVVPLNFRVAATARLIGSANH